MWWMLAEDISAVPTGGQFVTAGTVALAALTAFFSWLTNRDRLKFDFEKNNLRKDNERLTADVAELQADARQCHEDKEELVQALSEERRDREAQFKSLNERLIELREMAERKT
jgi:hypothetical protein